MNLTTNLSLGRFREEISGLKSPILTRDEPLEPLSISMQADSINIVLGASPYIALRSGSTSVCLSHILEIKRAKRHGKKSYKLICNDFTATDSPKLVTYHIVFPV